MVSLGVLLLIVFWIVSIVKNKNFDARLKYAQIIAENIEFGEVFEGAYLGGFEFGETPPRENLRKEIEGKFDSGVQSRLAFHFAETLPKWVLAAGIKDIEAGQLSLEESHGAYIRTQLYEFAAIRRSQLSDLLSNHVATNAHPDRRRRRRR